MCKRAGTNRNDQVLERLNISTKAGHQISGSLATVESEREALYMRKQIASDRKNGALPDALQQAVSYEAQCGVGDAKRNHSEAECREQLQTLINWIGEIGYQPVRQMFLEQDTIDYELEWPGKKNQDEGLSQHRGCRKFYSLGVRLEVPPQVPQ
jgi:hypothetical protein